MQAKMAGITFLTFLTAWPVATGHLRFLQVTTPLSISAEKSHPPYIAFAEAERLRLRDEWDVHERKISTSLTTETAATVSVMAPIAARPILQLEAMVVARTSAMTTVEPQASPNRDWIDGLSQVQQQRITEAQRRSDVLNSDWSIPTFEEEARKAIEQSGAVRTNGSITETVVALTGGVFIGGGTNADGTIVQPVRSVASVEIGRDPSQPETVTKGLANSDELEISGHFQIAEGLAFGPERFLEIRRRHEGVDAEQGRVDARDGSYQIRLSGRTGEIVARLRDEQGRILGEDSVHLSQIRIDGKDRARGPKFVLRPKTDIAGRHTSLPGQSLASLKTTAFSGAVDALVSKQGEFEINHVQKGSHTVLSAQARSHARTLMLVPAGFRSEVNLFTDKWVESLKQIVSEQRRMSLDGEDLPIIWGRVLQDGRPRAGLTVDVESVQGLEPVYFNQLLLPDPNLKATSVNGLFAFVGAPEGFQALVARAGDGYFAHQNVVVERGAVSVADLSTTLRTEQAVVRVYDAFVGDPREAQVLHQGLPELLEVDASGTAIVTLPVLSRLSLVQVRPALPYVPASYLLSDDDGFVHLPLVRDDWIRALQVWSKIDDRPNSSVVVGFVPGEAFSADVLDPEETSRIVYFDPQGRPTATGVAGGGFVIFGLSMGVREVFVTGEQTGLVASRVVPSDSRTITVLNFRWD